MISASVRSDSRLLKVHRGGRLSQLILVVRNPSFAWVDQPPQWLAGIHREAYQGVCDAARSAAVPAVVLLGDPGGAEDRPAGAPRGSFAQWATRLRESMILNKGPNHVYWPLSSLLLLQTAIEAWCFGQPCPVKGQAASNAAVNETDILRWLGHPADKPRTDVVATEAPQGEKQDGAFGKPLRGFEGRDGQPLWLYAEDTQRLIWHPATECWLAAMSVMMFDLCLHRNSTWGPGFAVFVHDEQNVHWDVGDLLHLGPVGDWERCIGGLRNLNDITQTGGATCSPR